LPLPADAPPPVGELVVAELLLDELLPHAATPTATPTTSAVSAAPTARRRDTLNDVCAMNELLRVGGGGAVPGLRTGTAGTIRVTALQHNGRA
jgi:hypothetical protein